MTIDVRADLGGSIDKGVVLRWNCRVGDRVRRGEALGELESDKATIELTAPEDGLVEAIVVAEGASFANGALLLRLVPRDLGTGPSDLAQRIRAVTPNAVAIGNPTERRCRFCQAIQIPGRDECRRCGAPL